LGLYLLASGAVPGSFWELLLFATCAGEVDPAGGCPCAVSTRGLLAAGSAACASIVSQCQVKPAAMRKHSSRSTRCGLCIVCSRSRWCGLSQPRRVVGQPQRQRLWFLRAQHPLWHHMMLMCPPCAGNTGTWFDTSTLVTNVRNFPNDRGFVVGVLKSFL
jgi:hypothetical protein